MILHKFATKEMGRIAAKIAIKGSYMRFSKGANLIEYIIPLALIGIVVGLGMFYLFSSGSMGNFFKASMGANQNGDKITVDKNIENEPLVSEKTTNISSQSHFNSDGSENDPVAHCDGSECTIDYGDFTLSGIPANFNEYVESSATSGGTDKISDLLMQIALQLEQEGKTTEASEVRKLANMGHNIASIQREFERIAGQCINANNCNTQYPYENQYNLAFKKPADYDDSYGKYPDGISLGNVKYIGCFGGTLYDTENNGAPITSGVGSFNNQFISSLNTVTAMESISPQMRGVIKELCWDIGSMAEDFQNHFCFLMGGTEQGYYDPETSELLNEYPSSDPGADFLNLNASKISDLDSSLICAAGRLTDEGKKCH